MREEPQQKKRQDDWVAVFEDEQPHGHITREKFLVRAFCVVVQFLPVFFLVGERPEKRADDQHGRNKIETDPHPRNETVNHRLIFWGGPLEVRKYCVGHQGERRCERQKPQHRRSRRFPIQRISLPCGCPMVRTSDIAGAYAIRTGDTGAEVLEVHRTVGNKTAEDRADTPEVRAVLEARRDFNGA
ncbi:MAG: hypothetical protein LiPW30_374 [Parcubacteria group bacterium LiPW_30]|nr:MAG: hypothetical protein LiPW30_374 [Parcubacteria group bacterium LiPW_30]